MNIETTYPPNYDVISLAFPGCEMNKAVFCYGETIHNPFNREITKDIEVHESVHRRQQGDDPAGWWIQYIQDKDFRLRQELEAYGEQFTFAKANIEAFNNKAQEEGKLLTAGKNNLIEYALDTMADSLSSSYGNLISHGEARCKLKRYAKGV